MVHSAKTRRKPSKSPVAAASSCCSETIFCCMVRMSSRPVRSPTWASRGYSCPPKLRWLFLPSLVRSNSAPYVSSSQARSGASLACSSAIRGLLRNLPPRMVSRKCTCQLSLLLTLPIAAAQPPSAMTVCALPNSDLQMIATRRPASCAAIAARRPEPPAPITRTSYECFSISSAMSVHDPRVGEGPGGDEADVGVGEHQGAEGDPRELHVLGVELGDDSPGLVTQRVAGEVAQPAADDVPARVAGDRVGPQQHDVDQ